MAVICHRWHYTELNCKPCSKWKILSNYNAKMLH